MFNLFLNEFTVGTTFTTFSGQLFHIFACDAHWETLVHDLPTLPGGVPSGLGVATLHVQMDAALTDHLGVTSIPAVVAVIDGRRHWFSGDISLANFRDFIRSLFPAQLITPVTGTSHQITGTSHQITGTSHQITGTSHQITGTSHQITGTSHQITGTSHQITADNGHVLPDNGHVSPDSGHVSPDNGHVSPDNGHVSPDNGHV